MNAKYILVLYLTLFSIESFGHEQIVHKAITANAEASAYAHSPAYTDFLNTISSDRPRSGTVGALNSMVSGSYDEDNADVDVNGNKDVGGKRSLNHFYDPLTGLGLSDVPQDSRVYVGTNSFTWASVSNCAGLNFGGYFGLGGNLDTSNIWSWQNARGYEWLGLTATNQLERQANLDNMFRAIGQVMHLLEDTSQPQHVRNEQHLDQFVKHVNTPWRSPIEDYGAAHVTNLNYGDGSMLNWRSADFTKLEDFWNRHLYNGTSATPLDNDANGSQLLGLAEWCNGNFLGVRHSYKEYYSPGDIQYYPYPSRDTGTDYMEKTGSLHSAVHGITLRNGYQGQAIYLNKTGDGITFSNHSRFTFLGGKFPSYGMITINDDNVLSNYHNLLIPKAVKYSAGLIDYFFRGTLGVGMTNLGDGTYGLFITNTSSQDFKDGSFHLFFDAENGVRTEITSPNFTTTYSGTLVAGSHTEAVFIPTNFPSYLLVYKGTIGTDGSGNALDSVDAEIAVSSQKFTTPIFNCDSKKITSTAFDAESGQPHINGSIFVYLYGGEERIVIFGSGDDGYTYISGRWFYVDSFFSQTYSYVDYCTGVSGPEDDVFGEFPSYSELGSDGYSAWDGSMPFFQVSDNECQFVAPCVGIAGGGYVNGSLELSGGLYTLTINAGGNLLWQGTSTSELGAYQRTTGISLNPPSLVLTSQ